VLLLFAACFAAVWWKRKKIAETQRHYVALANDLEGDLAVTEVFLISVEHTPVAFAERLED